MASAIADAVVAYLLEYERKTGAVARLGGGAVSHAPSVGVIAILAVPLLGGCVYYNGMYNTNRLAKSARKAEREGRPFEATSLWGQVITRAESVVVRHPTSKYAAQATVLRGLAHGPTRPVRRRGRAAGPGQPAAVRAISRKRRPWRSAGVMETWATRHPPISRSGELIDSKDPVVRGEARFQHARALRMTGRLRRGAALLRDENRPRQ